jgi:hypothetical protein
VDGDATLYTADTSDSLCLSTLLLLWYKSTRWYRTGLFDQQPHRCQSFGPCSVQDVGLTRTCVTQHCPAELWVGFAVVSEAFGLLQEREVSAAHLRHHIHHIVLASIAHDLSLWLEQILKLFHEWLKILVVFGPCLGLHGNTMEKPCQQLLQLEQAELSQARNIKTQGCIVYAHKGQGVNVLVLFAQWQAVEVAQQRHLVFGFGPVSDFVDVAHLDLRDFDSSTGLRNIGIGRLYDPVSDLVQGLNRVWEDRVRLISPLIETGTTS